jgi:hypothetical protein
MQNLILPDEDHGVRQQTGRQRVSVRDRAMPNALERRNGDEDPSGAEDGFVKRKTR